MSDDIPILTLDQGDPLEGRYVVGPVWEFSCADCGMTGDLDDSPHSAAREARRHLCHEGNPAGLLRGLQKMARRGDGSEVVRLLRESDL